MNRACRLVTGLAGVVAVLQLAGCPTAGPFEYIAGSEGARARLGDEASVQVLSPITDLAITGGTPVEVNWAAVATTSFAVVDIIFDPDQDPDNDNEVYAQQSVQLSETTALLDTTNLEANTYYLGVVLLEQNEIAAYDYAAGRLIVNQRTQLYFSSPADNFAFDRTQRVTPRFDVSWTLFDPDSTVTVQILLDPDDIANGNEFLLRETGPYAAGEQHTGTFAFNLPTALFEAGTYRILAIVSDGIDTAEFYAPASIRLRSRLAGYIDLRDLHLPESGVSGAMFQGFNPRDNLGSFLASLRDIDGDGYSDFIMLAQFAKPNYQSNLQRTGVGEAYMIYGRPNRFSGVINVNSTGVLFRGEIYTGVAEVEDPIRPSRGITCFTVLSDWDGDTVREFAFGLPFTDSAASGPPLDPAGYFRSGCVVIAAGSSLRPDLGFPGGNVLPLSSFGTRGHVPVQDDGGCGHTFIGPKAPATTGGGATSMHRYLIDVIGQPNSGSVRLGARLSSNEPFDQFGETVSAYAFDSIIMSAPGRDPGIATLANRERNNSIPGGGVVSVYYCYVSTGFWPWRGTNAPPASGGYPGTGEPDEPDRLPHHGPYHYIVDDFRTFSGRPASPGYVVEEDNSSPPDCALVWHNRAPTRFVTTRFWGSYVGGQLSNAKGIDDFNADGLQDILIGYPFANDGAGACFIVLGRMRTLVVGAELSVDELGLPMDSPNDPFGARIYDGIRVVGAPGTRLGQSQDRAGDFNRDGIPDVIIGSPLLNNRQGGAAIFFGSREVINLTEREIPLEELPERGLGVIFVGEGEGDLAGARVAGVGDIDGDGNDDIMIVAPNRSVRMDIDFDGALEIDRTDCGVVYLIYGSPDLRGTLSLADVGTEQLPGAVFIGRNSGDHLGAGLGDQGDRSVGIARAGDADGDGQGDLLMSSVSASPRDRARAGEVYLIYGQPD